MDQSLINKSYRLSLVTVPVTVIIPCYRCHKTIDDAMRSVFNQTVPPAEIILVEDCSDDQGQTLSKIDCIKKSYDGPIQIIIISLLENCGAGEARNVGWAIASQEFIAFLDSDDAWHPSKLAVQVDWMRSNPDYVMTCHDTLTCYNRTYASLPLGQLVQRELSWRRLLYKNEIATRSVMLKRATNVRFPEKIRYAEDYQLWLRILTSVGRGMRLCLPLAFSFKDDYGGSGLSSNLKAMHQGVIQCLKSLLQERKISKYMFLLFYMIEFFKYSRRVAITVFVRCRVRH